MDLFHECELGLEELSLSLPYSAVQRAIEYLYLLEKWNNTYNLTAIRDPAEMLSKHLLDSFSVVPFLNGSSVLDVGTGGGLPGIPIAIARPDIHVTLLDSVAKKTHFLTQAVHDLELNNVTVVNTRLKNFVPEAGFDTIVSRAFSTINVMLNSTGHLLSNKGQILAMKGVYPSEELQDLARGFKVNAVHTLVVPGIDGERHVVCMEREEQ